MTWKQFVETMKRAGVKDSDEIEYIDVSADMLRYPPSIHIDPKTRTVRVEN